MPTILSSCSVIYMDIKCSLKLFTIKLGLRRRVIQPCRWWPADVLLRENVLHPESNTWFGNKCLPTVLNLKMDFTDTQKKLFLRLYISYHEASITSLLLLCFPKDEGQLSHNLIAISVYTDLTTSNQSKEFCEILQR